MKKITYILVALVAVSLWACKPTEENYRAAYQRTMARDSVRTEFNETIYGKYRREVQDYRAIDKNDTANVKTTRVWLVKDEDSPVLNEQLKKYCVVIAEFKQLLNAKSIRDRFHDAGYPAAFIVQTPEPYYYVVAASYSDLAQAQSLIQKLLQDTPVRLKTPCPYILVPAHLRR